MRLKSLERKDKVDAVSLWRWPLLAITSTWKWNWKCLYFWGKVRTLSPLPPNLSWDVQPIIKIEDNLTPVPSALFVYTTGSFDGCIISALFSPFWMFGIKDYFSSQGIDYRAFWLFCYRLDFYQIIWLLYTAL